MVQLFSNLRFKNVCELLDILESTSLTSRLEAKRLFEESAEGFDEVAAFLASLGVLSADDQRIRLKDDFPELRLESRKDEILQWVLATTNRYRRDVFRFVGKFTVDNGDITYSSPDQSRSSESSVRNFLMDLGVVKYETTGDRYVLDPQYIGVYTSARSNRNLVSPAMLRNRSAAQDEIGLAAEEAIIEYERLRVGSQHADRIDHVARRNSGAGYDICSITQGDDEQILPRFIEVKAVSCRSYQFYWSRNELDVARDLAGWYYLYLLPVDGQGRFDLNRLKTINDPLRMLMGADSDWIIEPDGVACYQRVIK